MAITTNSILNKLTNKLSIQISLNGLSFCVLQEDTITHLKKIKFDRKLNPLELLDKLKALFDSEAILQSSFKDVCVIHSNELSTLVPKALFKEETLADYLKFNSKILKTDFISHDEVLLSDSVCVFVPYININNYIYDKFGTFTFTHVSSILIESILQLEKNAETSKVYVNVNSNYFELIIVENTKLLFYNTFEYSSKEDFIYFILFTAEQLGLNPEVFYLVFIGDIDKEDECYKIAYKYIRNISFGNRNDVFNFTNPPKQAYTDFALIKSL